MKIDALATHNAFVQAYGIEPKEDIEKYLVFCDGWLAREEEAKAREEEAARRIVRERRKMLLLGAAAYGEDLRRG